MDAFAWSNSLEATAKDHSTMQYITTSQLVTVMYYFSNKPFSKVTV